MPNSYTAPIHEGKDISFRDFILRCARGFGFAIEQRDEAADVPLRTHYEANTSFDDRELEKAANLLNRLAIVSDAELAEEAQAAYERQLAAHVEAKEAAEAERKRYDAMIVQVEAWEVPTELDEMKASILKWLRDSKAFDTDRIYPKRPERPPTGAEYRRQLLDEALRDVEYHSRSRAETIHRNADRNRYLRLLLESLDEHAAGSTMEARSAFPVRRPPDPNDGETIAP